MTKPLVSDMTQADFFELFVNCIKKDDLNEFVKKEDIRDFCTRDEITMIAQKASDHSTRKIEAAISKTLSTEIPKAFIRVGINSDAPQEMQELMVNMKRFNKNIETDKNNVRASAIKVLTTGLISIVTTGTVVIILKSIDLIK